MSAHRHRLYFRLQRATHLLKKAADRRLIAAAEVTTAQASVLAIVADGADGAGVTQSHIAGLLGQNESAVTAMIARLRGLGYVERQRSPADARVWLLRVTKKGEHALANMSGPFDEINKRLNQALGGADTADLAATLDRIADEFKNESEEDK
ncbi:MAG: MarR family winged helix-turn-helix transcriptional regulator [Pseudomonadota bacterium]